MPLLVISFSILSTFFSRGILCLVKLGTFAESTSHLGQYYRLCDVFWDKKIHFQAIDVIHTLFIIQMLSLCTVLALNWTRKNWSFLLVLILIVRGPTCHSVCKIVFPYCFPLFISPPVLIFQIIFFPKGKWKALCLSSVNSLPPTLVSISACVHHKVH